MIYKIGSLTLSPSLLPLRAMKQSRKVQNRWDNVLRASGLSVGQLLLADLWAIYLHVILKGGAHRSHEVRGRVHSPDTQGYFIAAGADSQLLLATNKLMMWFFFRSNI